MHTCNRFKIATLNRKRICEPPYCNISCLISFTGNICSVFGDERSLDLKEIKVSMLKFCSNLICFCFCFMFHYSILLFCIASMKCSNSLIKFLISPPGTLLHSLCSKIGNKFPPQYYRFLRLLKYPIHLS